MKHGFVKTAVCTPPVKTADVNYNLKGICDAINEASGKDVALLAFPELSVCGASCADLLYYGNLLEKCEAAVLAAARATKGKNMLVFIGAPLKLANKVYSTAVALFDGEIIGVSPKGELYSENTEISIGGRQYPFGKRLIFVSKNHSEYSVACELGNESLDVMPPSALHAMAGADIIVSLCSFREKIGFTEKRRRMISAASERLHCGYVLASSGVGESNTNGIFSGIGMIAENGKILEEGIPFEYGMRITDIDVEFLSFERSKHTGDIDIPDGYDKIFFDFEELDFALTRKFKKTPFIPEQESFDERCSLILDMQANALAGRILHTHAKKAVIGVSGGLDSTIALIVALRAMQILNRPAFDVVGITMPCFGTTERTKSNAVLLMEKLGIMSKTVSIKDAVTVHLNDIEHPLDLYDITYENAQARERTQVLMDMANSLGGIVVGTGDLSELALGWATYNGDHMSNYGVNCGVPKTLIPALLEYYSKTEEGKAVAHILTDIINTEISPELLPPDTAGNITQKTEDKVGPYKLHDFFLYHMIRRGASPEKIFDLAVYCFDGEFDSQTIKKWLKTFIGRFFSQQFKRNCIPDGVSVGSVSLSPDEWHMPSDAISSAWLESL